MATVAEKKKLLQFSTKELIKLCRKQGLPTEGNKKQLVDRLLAPKVPKSVRAAKKKKRDKNQQNPITNYITKIYFE